MKLIENKAYCLVLSSAFGKDFYQKISAAFFIARAEHRS